MKNISKIILPVFMLLALLTACSDNVVTDNPSSDTTTESLSSSPVPDHMDMTTPGTASLDQGEILYDGNPILQFMGADISEVIDVLGEPLDVTSRPPSTDIAGIYVYDRLYFHVDDNTSIGYITMSPDVCEIDGVSLDKNRDELISILGVPEYEMFDEEGEFSNYLLLDFEIQDCLVRFCLETSDEKASWMEVYTVSPEPSAASDTPDQRYIGEWYPDNDSLDYLIISEINDDTIMFELGLIRVAVIWAKAVINNNEIQFGENISPEYDGPAMNGTLEFFENSISVTISESEFEYIKAGTIYNFTIKNENFTYPESEALNLVKNYIADGNDSTFEPSSYLNPLSYNFKSSNYMIQYDTKLENQYHLIHEYEFVIDDSESGEGHTSTSNWYQVDILTGEIIPMFNKDGSLNENYQHDER